MSEVIRYLASYTPYEGLDLNGQCARHDGDYFVSAADFDRVTAERDALQQRLTAAEEELDQCQSMALMIEEKEWAEHVGKGSISSRVESAFTQLHNELSEARQGLTAADERADVLEGLLSNVPHIHFEGCSFQGLNADGSEAFEFEGEGLLKKVKSIRLIGWYCQGPKKVESTPYLKSSETTGGVVHVPIPVDDNGNPVSDKSGLIGVIRPEHRPKGVKP